MKNNIKNSQAALSQAEKLLSGMIKVKWTINIEGRFIEMESYANKNDLGVSVEDFKELPNGEKTGIINSFIKEEFEERIIYAIKKVE